MKRTIIAPALACFALLAMTSVASAQFPFGGIIQRGGQAIRNTGQVVRNTVVNRNRPFQNYSNNNSYQQTYNNGYQQTGQWSEWRPVNQGVQYGGTQTNRPSGGFPQGNGPSGFPAGGATGNGPSGFPNNGPTDFPKSGPTGGPTGFPSNGPGNGPSGFPGGFPSP